MPSVDNVVRARIEPVLKKESEEILSALGLTTSEAIRLFLTQVRLRRGLPFAVELDDHDTDLIPRSSQDRQTLLDEFHDD